MSAPPLVPHHVISPTQDVSSFSPTRTPLRMSAHALLLVPHSGCQLMLPHLYPTMSSRPLRMSTHSPPLVHHSGCQLMLPHSGCQLMLSHLYPTQDVSTCAPTCTPPCHLAHSGCQLILPHSYPTQDVSSCSPTRTPLRMSAHPPLLIPHQHVSSSSPTRTPSTCQLILPHSYPTRMSFHFCFIPCLFYYVRCVVYSVELCVSLAPLLGRTLHPSCYHITYFITKHEHFQT